MTAQKNALLARLRTLELGCRLDEFDGVVVVMVSW